MAQVTDPNGLLFCGLKLRTDWLALVSIENLVEACLLREASESVTCD